MRQVGEKGRESSCCSSDFLISEATRQEEEQSPSSTEDFTHSPVSSRWLVKNVDGDKKKILPDSLEPSTVSEIEMMKERFSKLLLGEDMSGSGNALLGYLNNGEKASWFNTACRRWCKLPFAGASHSKGLPYSFSTITTPVFFSQHLQKRFQLNTYIFCELSLRKERTGYTEAENHATKSFVSSDLINKRLHSLQRLISLKKKSQFQRKGI